MKRLIVLAEIHVCVLCDTAKAISYIQNAFDVTTAEDEGIDKRTDTNEQNISKLPVLRSGGRSELKNFDGTFYRQKSKNIIKYSKVIGAVCCVLRALRLPWRQP